MSAIAETKRSLPLPRREGRAPVRDRFVAMLLLVTLLHAILLLGISFTDVPGGERTPQLDVMLVTNEVAEARSNEHAAYLAQRTQIGAGNTDEPRSSSPASRGLLTSPPVGSGASAESAKDSQDSHKILASSGPSPDIQYIGELRSDPGGERLPLILGETPGEPRSGRGDSVELLLRGHSSAQHWVTPDTRASRLAPYLASWKRKVEHVGTLHFPAVARSAGLSGSPVVEVQIAADGHLVDASVRRSSGFGALDQAAMTILRLASPFDPFPADLSAEYSRLRFAYQWDFEAGAVQPGAVTVSSDTASGP